MPDRQCGERITIADKGLTLTTAYEPEPSVCTLSRSECQHFGGDTEDGVVAYGAYAVPARLVISARLASREGRKVGQLDVQTDWQGAVAIVTSCRNGPVEVQIEMVARARVDLVRVPELWV